MKVMRNLKSYRQRAKKTQKEIADYLGIERSTYAKYESGASEPTFDTLRRLADLYGASIDELMGFPSSPPVEEDTMKAAFWGGDKDLSQEDLDAMWADVKNFAAFVAEKKKREKQQDG